VAHFPGLRQRTGCRFERLINKAPGSVGGYLLGPDPIAKDVIGEPKHRVCIDSKLITNLLVRS
jgi:hypothetical protein